MPPKKVAKRAPKKAPKNATVKEEEDYDTPIKVQATEAQKNALLPYLALGLGPVTTSGAGLYCGINALHISYNAAREALAGPGKEPRKLTNAYFHNIFKSPAYRDAVANSLAIQKAQDYFKFDPEAELERERRRLMSPNNLFEAQVAIILDIINHEQKTNFQLGCIEQGFRGIWRSATKCDIEAVYDTQLPVAELRGFRNQPVLWIWQNNTDKQGAPGSKKGAAHWEGMAISKDKPSGERTGRVQAWGLGTEVEKDVKRDIGNDGKDQMLEAGSGSFVREVSLPPGMQVPDGMRYMEHTNGEHVGLVMESSIRRIETIHANAPTAATDPAWVAQDGPSDIETKPRPNPMQQFIPGSTKPVVATETYRGVPTPFTIFRTVEITDKIGTMPKNIDDNVKYMDSYTYDNGGFVLKTGEPYPRNGTTIVTNIQGVEGYVRNRVLQTVFSPWGLQDTLPAAADIGLTVASSAEAIQNEARKWGMEEVSKNKARAIKDIKEFQDARTCYLPMYRVLKDIETITIKTFADGEEKIIFQEGEIVLGGLGTTKGQREVTDFEGYVAVVPDEQLELINRPWNLRLSNEGMRGVGWAVPTEGPAPIIIADAAVPAKGASKGTKRSRPADDDHDDHDDDKPTKKAKTSSKSKASSSSEDDLPIAQEIEKIEKEGGKRSVALPTPPRESSKKTTKKSTNKNSKVQVSSPEEYSEDELAVVLPTPLKKTKKSKK